MLRKNKIVMLGKNSNNHLVSMNSNDIHRNFAPESYMQTILNEIHNSDVPDFETPCAYTFSDKIVKFEDLNTAPTAIEETTKIFMLSTDSSKDNLFDYVYFINTSDVFIKLDINGDCLSDSIRVKKLNLAPRSVMVLKLDRVEAFNIEENNGRKKKVFYKNTSDLDINLEYNIYMTRLL